jgi:ankyrin repeat protein
MQNKPQEEKDKALQKILMINFSDPGYYLKRYHLAAAALIGANVNMSSLGHSPLSCATLFQDAPLCVLLLKRPGTDPNWREYDRANMPLLYVKKVFLAHLFLNAGANLMVRGASGATYLHYAMRGDYEPQLVRWCIAYGIDPLAKDNGDFTPLHDLIVFAYQHKCSDLKEKVDYLLESLDFEPMQELIKSVKVLIERNNYQTNVQWLNNYLQAKISTQKIS